MVEMVVEKVAVAIIEDVAVVVVAASAVEVEVR